MDKTDLLPALSKMTYGLYAITTGHETKINAMIASWVSQVSYAPFLIMVAVHPNRYTHDLILNSGRFALHVLAQDQVALIHRLKGPDPHAKFDDIPWKQGVTGCPVLKDCVAYMECTVVQTHHPGNHTLFIGEVAHAECLADTDRPLSTLDYDGTYTGKA